MPVTRINEFRARDGEADALLALLRSVAPAIEGSPGCRSCDVLRSERDPTRVVVIESWESVEAHQASASRIPREQLEQAMSLLAEPPSGDYFSA